MNNNLEETSMINATTSTVMPYSTVVAWCL